MVKNMGISGRKTAVAALLLFMLPVAGHASDKTASVGLGFEFTSGDYGTGIRTNSLYVPVTVEVTPTDRWGVSLEIPYVYQSSSAVVAGEFRGMQQQSMGLGSQSVVAAMGSTGGPGPRTNAPATDIGKSQSGLGDITLRAGYIVVPEGDYLPAIRPNFFVKLPTADKNKFLGTGAFV